MLLCFYARCVRICVDIASHVWSRLEDCIGRLLFVFQAEDGIRDLVRSRGLGDVYKRQARDGRRYGLFGRQVLVAAEAPGSQVEQALQTVHFLSLIHI